MLDQFIGQTLADKYRIDSVMRETDLGTVYHATHLSMEKAVAVKILSPALSVDENIVKRFSAEARNISNISHPNILNVADFGSDANGKVYIVFEAAEGETLKNAIERDGMFDPARAVNIAKQIAAGLAAAHFKGVTHRSLNGENILLTLDDSVKVLDLGTAKSDEPTDDEVSPQKIEYLSPEQCADASNADERSDIYSLGVILYEMLAGEVPFKAENTSELMMKHAQEPPPPLSAFRHDLPAGIEPLILQALAKNPEMRHQNAAELIDDLNRVSRSLTDLETGAIAKTPAANNNFWKTAFVVLAGIALLSIALIWATSTKQTNPSTFQADSNSQPVQPLNPATGMNEQGLATIVPMTEGSMGNSNVMVMPETLGTDGNPNWQNGTVPPGAPQYIQPGGQYFDPNNPNSPFNPDDPNSKIYQDSNGATFIIVPTTPNSNTNTQPTTTKTPKNSANTGVKPSPSPAATTNPQTSPTPDTKSLPVKTPAPTPKPADKTKTPPASTKTTTSGKTQDS